MTAEEKRRRALAVENMFYLYKKYYPLLKDEITEYCKQKSQVEIQPSNLEGVPIDFNATKW